MSNTDSGIVRIPLDQLHESPFNPRKRFTGLEELATTIKADGVLQPLLVRPRVPALFQSLPDAADTAACGYEVVFGHRRLRASQLAGVPDAPCMVKAMTDEEARRAQVVENLQREDVHPFEEAEGFEQLMREDGLSADQVAEQFGKSRAYVYARLKLLQAIPQVRDACLDGVIVTEVALLIARLRYAKLQEKALAGVRNRLGNSRLEDGGKDSYRRVRDYLVDHFTLELKSAIFDPEDATLLPAAGVCSACPKLSGNAPEFEDVATARKQPYGGRPCGPDVCTDPDCFAEKKGALLARKAEQLQGAGQAVVTGAKARQAISADGTLKGGYVPLKDVQAALKKAGKGEQPQVVNIINQRTGQVVKAVKAAELPKSAQPKAKPAGKQRDWEAERREQEKAREIEQKRRDAMAGSIRDAMRKGEGSTFELRLVVWLLLQDMAYEVEQTVLKLHGIDHGNRRDYAWLDAFNAEQLRHLLLDLVLETARDVGYEPEDRHLFDLLAQHYGVADPTSTPSTAGAGADEAAAGAGDGQAEDAAAAGGADESQKDEAPAGAVAGQKDKRAAKAPRGVRYRDAATGNTWSGKGLKPAWLRAALADGKTLADFEVTA